MCSHECLSHSGILVLYSHRGEIWYIHSTSENTIFKKSERGCGIYDCATTIKMGNNSILHNLDNRFPAVRVGNLGGAKLLFGLTCHIELMLLLSFQGTFLRSFNPYLKDYVVSQKALSLPEEELCGLKMSPNRTKQGSFGVPDTDLMTNPKRSNLGQAESIFPPNFQMMIWKEIEDYTLMQGLYKNLLILACSIT